MQIDDWVPWWNVNTANPACHQQHILHHITSIATYHNSSVVSIFSISVVSLLHKAKGLEATFHERHRKRRAVGHAACPAANGRAVVQAHCQPDHQAV